MRRRYRPVRVFHGDCLDVLGTLADNSVDSVVTDPPYALAFMGKHWDHGDVAHSVAFWAEVLRVLKPGGHALVFGGTRTYHRLACAIEDAGFEIRDQIGWVFGQGFPKSQGSLKPAHEPICLARKPLIGTVAANVLAHGTGALNVDGCRVEGAVPSTIQGQSSRQGEVYGSDQRNQRQFHGHVLGRWPANLIHDGSDEVLAAFPNAPGQLAAVSGLAPSSKTNNVYGQFEGRPATSPRNDSGSAARFFYHAKANAADRAGSKHPTVKPINLMAYLIRLITPPGGLVLDPFAGSGTTGTAARREGMRAILIEREAEYVVDIQRRLDTYV